MKLRKKIRYIILPVIMLVFTTVSVVYYEIYKTQLIESKLISLDNYFQDLFLQTNFRLEFSKSYIRQKIGSKEASLIFNAKERGKTLSAPYVTQFLNLFFDDNHLLTKNNHIINDFLIMNSDSELIIHINTLDPFADPLLKKQTITILNSIKDKKTKDKKISQYYYFLNKNNKNNSYSLYVIQLFSPYHLLTKSSYDKKDNLYLVQAEVNIDFLQNGIANAVKLHQGFFYASLDSKKELADTLQTTVAPFLSDNDGFYVAQISNELVNLELKLDKNYFSEDLLEALIKLLILNFFLIIICYFILIKLINKQIITPITSLASSIKSVEVSSRTVKLTPLTTKDEVADLNESYISLINKINNLANNDALTGLQNRASFNDKLLCVTASNQKSNTYTALFFIDLDNFKLVNDTFGHDTGDQLLIVFSQRLRQIFRAEERFLDKNKIDSIARLGGDEFVILMNKLPSVDSIKAIAQRICDLFTDGFTINTQVFDVHASIGIAYAKHNDKNGETLLNQADTAMYLAKKDGKNNFKFFSAALEEKIDNEKNIEKELNNAHLKSTFFLVFMPAYSVSTLKLKGYEVLLRCPALIEQGIGPDLFIPIAEKTDLILNIDLWVAEHALIKLADLINNIGFDGFFSINISSRSLRNEHFYFHLKNLIKKYKINARQLEVEITETCLMPDDHKAIHRLNQLKSLGIKIALDDFGTGYTSFSQLVNYPLDTLKIDRSFVTNLAETPTGKKPTLDIIFELAKVYQLEVIVEGVETQENFDHINALSPDILVQGYYFTKPVSWQALLKEVNNVNSV